MKRERPSLIVRKTKRGLAPVSAFDEERLHGMALNTECEVKPLTKRSNSQLRLYWSVLSRVVAATGIAPTAAHLSDLLKVHLGYCSTVYLLDKRKMLWPDSIALEKMGLFRSGGMPPDEFNEFFQAAMAFLAERCGFDPLLEFSEGAAA
jgi:hypothetical protein